MTKIGISISIPSYKSNKSPEELLDKISDAVAAYSLRKIKATSTKAIRVRRSSDNTETDIGFVNNALDITSLQNFVGNNDGLITKWYDQSGNNNDAVQATATNQPRIINTGVIDLVNSIPAIYFNGTSNHLYVPHNSTINLQNLSASFVQKGTRSAGAALESFFQKGFDSVVSTGWQFYLRTNNPTIRMLYYGTSQVASGGAPPDPRDGNSHHLVGIKNGGNLLIYENGTNYINETYAEQTITNTRDLYIGVSNNSPQTSFYQGYMQEIILFSGSIQNNISQLYNYAKSTYGVV
jgi:hypothetical protein